MKVVINDCYGGFGLSKKAVMRYAELEGIKIYPYVSSIIYDVHKKVYGKEPTVDDPDVMYVSYSTKPSIDGEDAGDNNFYERDIPRSDPNLVKVIKEMGDKANSRHSKLKIVEIPSDIEWEIEEYDGMEWVAEKHRTWR